MTKTTMNIPMERANEIVRRLSSPRNLPNPPLIGKKRGLPAFAVPALILTILATFPYIGISLPGILPGPLNSPPSMQLLALCAVTAGIALSYELLFGRTGLMSFGHTLFIGAGAYTVALLLGKVGASLVVVIIATMVLGIVAPLVVGAIALRVKGIAFSMVTLAFAEVASIGVAANFGGLTGGEDGLGLIATELPRFVVGIANAPYRYWLALAFLALAWGAILYLDQTRIGRSWAAIRENEQRVEVLGLSAYRAKLASMVVAGLLGTIGGVLQLLLSSAATPSLFSLHYSLQLLIIIVLGGVGSKYGAVLGAFLYTLLDTNLAHISNSDWVAALPPLLSVPLSQPQLLIGVIFILFVFFVPGGLTSIPGLFRRRRRSIDPFQDVVGSGETTK